MKNTIFTILFSIAFGHIYSQCVQCSGSSSSGTNASAIGTNTIASGHSSFASGFGTQATYQYTTAIGFYSFATQTAAVSIGSMVKATFDRAIVIGSGADYSTGKYLINPRPRSLMIGFNSINPTIFVSESPSNANFDRTGLVGIGNITQPTAKLHIKADDNEDASLKLDATGTGKYGIINFTAEHSIKAKANDNLTFATQIGKNFVFLNGNMGVGTTADPVEKLEVNGNIKQTTGFNLITSTVKAPDANGLKLYNNTGTGIFVSNTGSVGVGNNAPVEKLEVSGNIKQTAGFNLITSTVKAPDANGLKLYNSDGSGIFVSNTGNVGIGTTNTSAYKLSVAGKIIAQEVKIVLSVPASDFVFEKDYALMPLTDVEQYINNHKHLPEVPSADKFRKDGYGVGEMDDLLLRKIEELTLYIISQQKEIDAMKKQLKLAE